MTPRDRPRAASLTRADLPDELTAESLRHYNLTSLRMLQRPGNGVLTAAEQQQLEHQESQRLLDTRGFFFAFLVSVAVIVAGVAPLVEAEPRDRILIAVWTVVACVLAALVYAGVRATQRKH